MSIRKVALESLKTKFEGIDEKVLGRIAAKIAKTAETEDDARAEVEDLTMQSVIDSYVDSRVTEGVTKAIEGYETKHGLKDGKKVETKKSEGQETDPDPKQSKNDDDMPAWAQKIMAEVASLKESKRADTRNSRVEKLLAGIPEEKRKSFEREFKRAKFEDDEDFDSWIAEITPDIEAIANDGKASASTSGKPKGGGGGAGEQVNPLVQARADARKEAATASPVIKGLPNT